MLLEIHDISKQYDRGAGAFFALENITLSVAEGEFITVTGRSGSGKTTLLTIISGLTSPSGGNVVFDGQSITALPDARVSSLRCSEISYIPQGASLLGNFTVFDNIRISQALAGKGIASDSSRAAYLMDQMGIGHLALEYPKNLSGGEMRRVAIARALFNNPRLLLADEPTSDLDPENAQAVLDLFLSINQHGTALLIATHEEKVAEKGKRRLHMDAGKLM